MRNLRKVRLQHIRFDHLELAVLAQPGGQVAVQLHHREPSQAFDQGLRQGGQAGADLDHRLACQRGEPAARTKFDVVDAVSLGIFARDGER